MATSQSWVNEYKHMMDVSLRRKLLNSLHPDNKHNFHFPVLIQFKQKLTNARIRSFKQLMGDYSFTMGHKLGLINAISGKASIACLQKMCQTEMVRCVYLNRKVRKTLDIATPAVGSLAAQRSGATGAGVTIAILDTGIFHILIWETGSLVSGILSITDKTLMTTTVMVPTWLDVLLVTEAVQLAAENISELLQKQM